ncbi:hypothetical protein D9756_006327 [Leucocoprinus leucothites]|uniref:Protein kinase domain-containing protein n=1 Tax=Leucocoprinus leucothites TaxID=201217 RepID=A0A8H5D4C3_9AGAR|nr:hypothetical protein D9756_006327 [Leucoagaricus leucothites]
MISLIYYSEPDQYLFDPSTIIYNSEDSLDICLSPLEYIQGSAPSMPPHPHTDAERIQSGSNHDEIEGDIENSMPLHTLQVSKMEREKAETRWDNKSPSFLDDFATSPKAPLEKLTLPVEPVSHPSDQHDESEPTTHAPTTPRMKRAHPGDGTLSETKRTRVDESVSASDGPYTISKLNIEESPKSDMWVLYEEATRTDKAEPVLSFPGAPTLSAALDDFDDWLGWDFASQSSSGSQDESTPLTTASNGMPEAHESQDSGHPELLEALSDVLLNEEQRERLCTATRGDHAQTIVDYLHSVLLRQVLPKEWLRRHCLIALYKLCKYSQLYPYCYILRDSIVPGACEGFGGFSDIFKGKFGDKELCLKLVRLNKTNMDVMLRRYAKEAILWGQLNHPNITPFYGIYYLDAMRRQLCLVSPWMRHGDVVEYLKKNPLAPGPCSCVYDVVAGLDYLHDLGLIHSDLKGANILVNDFEHACITDFGMSFVRTDKTLANAMVTTSIHGFTQRWASPELLEEEARPSMASDIWALGCVFYEIMTGKLPFEHLVNDAQIALALLKGKLPTRPHYVPDQIEAVIWEQVDRCWTPEAGKRPKCRDILLKLQWAGLLRKVYYEAQRDSERESQHLRDVMRMGGGERVDLEVVEKVLQGVRGV